MLSHIVNPQNSAFRFTIVRAITTGFMRRSKTHWCIVSEHMSTQNCVSVDGPMPFKKWAEGKEIKLTFQFTEKNQNKMWVILQYLLTISLKNVLRSEKDFLSGVALMIDVAKGVESPDIETHQQLTDFLVANVPLLTPPEMIMWEQTLCREA